MVFEFSKLVRDYPIGRAVAIKTDGYIDTVRVSGYQFENGTWYVDTEEGGIILLSRLEQMEVKPDKPASVREILSDVSKEICDNYCRFPECYEEEEELHEQKCGRCPLNRLK